MKQIAKFSIALTTIFLLASCQSSKSGCYDFSSAENQSSEVNDPSHANSIEFTKVVCRP